METDFHAYLHTSYSAMVVVEIVKEFSVNINPPLPLSSFHCRESLNCFCLLKNNFLTWMKYFICYDLYIFCGSYNTTKTYEFLGNSFHKTK